MELLEIEISTKESVHFDAGSHLEACEIEI